MENGYAKASKSDKKITVHPEFQTNSKENQKVEGKQANPNPIEEDQKLEENEKDFGEYDANAVLPKNKIERKNST